MTTTYLLPARAASLAAPNGNGHHNGHHNGNGHKPKTQASPYRLAPNDADAEEALLAAVLFAPTLIERICPALTSDDFLYLANWELYRAMFQVHTTGLFMTTENIRGALGADFKPLADADNKIGHLRRNWMDVDIMRIDAMVTTLKKYAMQRRVLSLADDLATLAHQGMDNLPGQVQALVTQRLTDAAPPHDKIVTFAESVSQLYDNLESGEKGIPTGLSDLDGPLQGLKPGRMCILAGRPGSGKSSLCLQIALHAEKQGYHVGIMSMEMQAVEVAQRAFAMEMGVDTNDQELMKPESKDVQWQAFLKWTQTRQRRIWFDESTLQTPSRIAAVARAAHRRGELDLLIIDYLQLMDGDKGGKNRNEELTAITRELANLAKELGIHILVACQMNRAIEYADRLPRLSDLRDSGSIEADAYQVVFLHRKTKDDSIPEDDAPEAPVEIQAVIAKNRNGKIKVVPLLFQQRRTRFVLPTRSGVNVEAIA